MQNSIEQYVDLGTYHIYNNVYHLFYDGTHITRPMLVVQLDDRIIARALPPQEYVKEQPDEPLSVAYKRAQEKGLKLSNLYKTQEAAEMLTAEIAELRAIVRQEIAERGIELELPEREVRPASVRRHLNKRAIPMTMVSGDYYIDEEIYAHLLQYYSEGYRKSALKLEKEEHDRRYMILAAVADLPGMPTRQQLYNLRDLGLIEVKEEGARNYVSMETVEKIKQMYEQKRIEKEIRNAQSSAELAGLMKERNVPESSTISN